MNIPTPTPSTQAPITSESLAKNPLAEQIGIFRSELLRYADRGLNDKDLEIDGKNYVFNFNKYSGSIYNRSTKTLISFADITLRGKETVIKLETQNTNNIEPRYELVIETDTNKVVSFVKPDNNLIKPEDFVPTIYEKFIKLLPKAIAALQPQEEKIKNNAIENLKNQLDDF